GAFAVQLVAHNGRQAAKQAAAVKVESPAPGTITAVLKVTDAGSRVEQVTRLAAVAVQVPKEQDKTPGFTKTIPIKPAFTLIEAFRARRRGQGVKALKGEAAGEKKPAGVSGGGGADDKGGKPAGSDILIGVKLVEERPTGVESPPTMVCGTLPPP